MVLLVFIQDGKWRSKQRKLYRHRPLRYRGGCEAGSGASTAPSSQPPRTLHSSGLLSMDVHASRATRYFLSQLVLHRVGKVPVDNDPRAQPTNVTMSRWRSRRRLVFVPAVNAFRLGESVLVTFGLFSELAAHLSGAVSVNEDPRVGTTAVGCYTASSSRYL